MAKKITMLNLFLSNRASTVIIIPIMAFIFWFGSFFSPLPENIHPTFLYALLFNAIGIYPLLNKILGFLSVVILTYLVSRIFNANDFYNKENAMPSLMLVIMLGAWNGFHYFTPIYISMILLLLAVNPLLKIYHQKSIYKELFDSSLLIGLAALFYYPILLFGLSIWGFLIISRSFSIREFLLPFMGLFLPFYFLSIAFFYFDIPPDFLNFSSASETSSLLYQVGLTQRFYLVISAILLVFSLVYLLRMFDRSKVQVQLSRKFLFMFLINGMLIYWTSLFYYPIFERALFIILPLALILPFSFLESKPTIRNISFYFWLIAALLFDYVAI